MRRTKNNFTRIALVLPTEFAYARGVLRGVISATRARNLYADELPRNSREKQPPWLFRIYRGIYGHSSKYLARWFKDWNPDGIIGQIYDDRLANVYRETGKPVVELFESRADSEFPRVLPDDTATGVLAAKHFIERGFRHFGFYGAPWMIWSQEREEGFRNEIERTFGERAASGKAANTTFTFASFAESSKQRVRPDPRNSQAAAMGEWLKTLPQPLAVFVANDLWGFEFLQAAREAGRLIPEQVAVLGVDNEELLCEMAYPPLSSVRLGAEQIGHTAVAVMEQLLRGGRSAKSAPAVSRIPPLDVVTRQSTDILAVEDPDVAAALRHIRSHAASGLSVKQLLDEVPVNRRTLERRFVSMLGHTPLEEIHRVRLERVKLLLQTELPIYEVASRCGFTTPEHLATSFLRAVGQTPTAFRQQYGPRTRWQSMLPAI